MEIKKKVFVNRSSGHVDDDIDEDNSEDEIDLFQQKFTCNYGSTGHLDWLLGTLHVPKSAAWFHAMLPNVLGKNQKCESHCVKYTEAIKFN